MTTTTITPQVTDTDTDTAIVIARLHGWLRHNDSYRGQVETLLRATGLDGLLPGGRSSFTVALDTLTADLATPATITLYPSDEGADPSDVARSVRDYLITKINPFIDSLYNRQVTAEPVPQPRLVDVDTITAAWGTYYSLFPAGGTPEVEAFRNNLVRTVLKTAVEHDYCPTVEHALRDIGLGAYLPARTKQITVEIRGYGTTPATSVTLDRVGEVSPEDLKSIAIEHIKAQLDADGALEYRDARA